MKEHGGRRPDAEVLAKGGGGDAFEKPPRLRTGKVFDMISFFFAKKIGEISIIRKIAFKSGRERCMLPGPRSSRVIIPRVLKPWAWIFGL